MADMHVDDGEFIRIRRAMNALSLRKVERDFYEGFSFGRSEEISESLSDLAEESLLDADFDSLVKRNVFASFQVLHLSGAVARARQGEIYAERQLRKELSDWKDAFHKAIADFELERSSNDEDLLELERTCAELKMAKEALTYLDQKMLRMLDDHKKELKEAAVQYTLIARIGMMQEPVESRDAWDVAEEIRIFKMKFPDSNLVD